MHREHSLTENTADSAGFPWEGRSFEQHSDAFANDHGETPAELAAVLRQLKIAEAELSEALAVFSKARLLIPLLTVAGDLGETPDGRIVDKTQELSIVTVKAPDGRSVLPVFSSVAAMRRWNPDARPVPNFGKNVALAALDDGNDLVILDPGTPETQLGLRRPALWALADDEQYAPSWADDRVLAEFTESIKSEESVDALSLAPGDPNFDLTSPELLVRLSLQPGLDQAQVAQLLGRLQQRWASSEIIAKGVDSMMLRIESAEQPS